jgi:hypothetical protein
MVKPASSSKWTSKSGTGFTNISNDGTLGVKASEAYKCTNDECTKYQIPTVSVEQVASGKSANWLVTKGGELYMSLKDKLKWTVVKTPANVKVKYVAIGLDDEVYLVTDQDLYISSDGKVDTPTWVKIPGAPKFISLSVNKEVHGIDINGKMWKS